MKAVAGSWALEVIAGGKDLLLDTSNLQYIYVISNVQQPLPSVSLGFKDDTGKALQNVLGDGEPLTVSIGNPDFHIYNGLQFLTSGLPKILPTASYSVMEYNGWLNKPKWLRKVVDKHYEGPASSVIAQLASEAGLIPEVDTSQDAQIWLPTRTSLSNYAHHILQRSWIGEADALMMAVMDNAKLKLKGINNITSSSEKLTFSNLPDQGQQILDYKVRPRASSANAAGGYGVTSIGIQPDGQVFEGNDVSVKMMSAATSIGAAIKESVGQLGTRINALSPLAGNTHDKWYEALHQNVRVKSTYAFDIEFLTDIPTKLEVFDTIQFNPVSAGQEVRALSGKYIVTAINKLIVAGRYLEKLVISAQGPGGV